MSIDTARVPTRSSVRATATWVLWMNLYLAGWFWLMAVIVITAALVVITVVGEVNTSIVAFARQGAVWFPFSVLIAITAAYLPVHVGGRSDPALPLVRVADRRGRHGPRVRRRCSPGCSCVERAVFAAFGWQWRILDDISLHHDGHRTDARQHHAAPRRRLRVRPAGGDDLPARSAAGSGRSPCRSPPVRSCWSSPCSRRTPARSPPPGGSAATSRSSSPPRRPC